MGEKDIGSPSITTQADKAPELIDAAHTECREACAELERTVCIDKLIQDLAIPCSDEERKALIPLLIQKEKQLPKLLTELPLVVAGIQINQLLPNVRKIDSQQALTNEDETKAELAQGVEGKKENVSELTQGNQNLDDEHKQDQTTIAVLVNDVEGKTDLLSEQQTLLKQKLTGRDLLEAMGQLKLVKQNTALQNLLADFGKILSLAQTPEDAAILERKISGVDFASMPDPVVFIQTEILKAPELSQATQEAIAREFKITPYRVITGSDVKNAFGETIIDPETGEERQRFTEDEPLEYRTGISAFNGKSGESFIRFDVDPPVKFNIDGWSPDAITDLSEYGALFVGFQEAGISNFMVHNFHLPNALDPQFDPLDAVKSRQIVDALLGFDEGYDGKIYGADKTKYFQWFVQMLSPRGDWAQSDFDVNASHQALEDLGVRGEDGTLNIEVLKSVGSYARGIYGSGVPDYYALQGHLNSLYGDLVPLTGETPKYLTNCSKIIR